MAVRINGAMLTLEIGNRVVATARYSEHGAVSANGTEVPGLQELMLRHTNARFTQDRTPSNVVIRMMIQVDRRYRLVRMAT